LRESIIPRAVLYFTGEALEDDDDDDDVSTTFLIDSSYFAPRRGAKYCDAYVCSFFCLSVPSDNSKLHS